MVRRSVKTSSCLCSQKFTYRFVCRVPCRRAAGSSSACPVPSMWSNARCSHGKPACDRAVSAMHDRALRGSTVAALHAHRCGPSRDARECPFVCRASGSESSRGARRCTSGARSCTRLSATHDAHPASGRVWAECYANAWRSNTVAAVIACGAGSWSNGFASNHCGSSGHTADWEPWPNISRYR